MSTRQQRQQQAIYDSRPATQAVRMGTERTPQGEHSQALFLTSSFVFDDAANAAARFADQVPGNIYSRFTNPTLTAFETKLACLEGAQSAVATASGMAAIASTILGLLQTGDHIICAREVFGSTITLLNKHIKRFGIDTSFVSLSDCEAWQQALTPNSRMMLLETPSNPLNSIGDLRQLAALADAHNCLLVVDNSFCTPILQQPLEFGTHLVVHTATKYLDGQGRCLGGAIAGSSEHIDKIRSFMRASGPVMSPFNAWVFNKGLETLNIRMQGHSTHALTVAKWLEQHAGVSQVFYGGLDSHPQKALAQQQQSGFGSVISFKVHGGQKEAWQFIDGTCLISLTANLGDACTTITHPATTTHGKLSETERQEAGITQNLIRIAVGLEDPLDICEDLQRGFEALE